MIVFEIWYQNFKSISLTQYVSLTNHMAFDSPSPFDFIYFNVNAFDSASFINI